MKLFSFFLGNFSFLFKALPIFYPSIAWSADDPQMSSSAHIGLSSWIDTSRHEESGEKPLLSHLLLDVDRKHSSWSVGFRSVISDSQIRGRELYRLTVGPVFKFSWDEHWSIHGFLGLMRESVSGNDGSEFRGSGWGAQVSWLRSIAVLSDVKFNYGGFLDYHSASLQRIGSGSVATMHQIAKQKHITELGKGLIAGLQLPL